MTRDEMHEALLVERFGPIPRPKNRRPTPAEVTAFELENERAQQRIRRETIEKEVANGPAVGAA